MRVLTWDTETSYNYNKPWLDKSYISLFIAKWLDSDEVITIPITHNEAPRITLHKLRVAIQELFDVADIVVAHNIKFDMHWMQSLGISIPYKCRIYDTMIAEYCLIGQDNALSVSLEESAIRYSLPAKLDIVKNDYWLKGIDTYSVPLDILTEYGIQDVIITEQLYLKQRRPIHTEGLSKLVALRCESLRVTQSIEYNGMLINTEACAMYSVEYGSKIDEIRFKLKEIIYDTFPELSTIEFDLNLNSNDQLSAFLFGGEVQYIGRIAGKREGTTKKAMLNTYVKGFGFKPAKGTETKKKGYYKTDVTQLNSLRGGTKQAKVFILGIMELAKLEKQKGTYFDPFIEINTGGYIHPSINECVTATGRYSSSQPNAQNIPRGGNSPIKSIFISRYDKESTDDNIHKTG